MSTAELTRKIESLSVEDYNLVIMLVNSLSEKYTINSMERYSEDELIEQLSESIEKSDNGDTVLARDFAKLMRGKYAV